ncbi:hypothetical protein KDL45_13305, partial [bacterium]|nr:hypothetical protein [bacterium]
MPYELRNADILMISLVKDPATGRQVIFKSRDGQPDFGRTVQFAKADDEKQIVYGIAYPAGSPEKTDAHGDFATPAEVAAMAARFMRNARTVAGVDRDHDYRAMKGVTVVESWIVRQGDPLFGNPEDVGAWAVGVHIEDKSLYDEFKKTGYRGFS